jgi:hypothetical protein
MSRHLVRSVYVLAAGVVWPLIAWHAAVDATNHGHGARGFFALLLGIPVCGAVVAAMLLRRSRREATFGAAAALAATGALVGVLVLVTLSSR